MVPERKLVCNLCQCVLVQNAADLFGYERLGFSRSNQKARLSKIFKFEHLLVFLHNTAKAIIISNKSLSFC